MNLITITDEMLESAHIEESDRKNLKKARCYGEDRMQINVEASISQAFVFEDFQVFELSIFSFHRPAL